MLATRMTTAIALLATIGMLGCSAREKKTENSSPAASAAPQSPAAVEGSTNEFRVLAGTTITSVGSTAITGELGVWPGTAVTGFGPGTISGNGGQPHKADAVAEQAQSGLTTAFNDAAGRSTGTEVSGNIGGRTLSPGVYSSTSSLEISSGDLTLDGKGDPEGLFVFRIPSAFTVTSGRKVTLINGARAANVFWQVGSSATLGTTSDVSGTIMAMESISMSTGATLHGRALARNGAVTMDANIVTP